MPTNKNRNTIPRLRFAGLRQQINKLTAEAEQARSMREFGKVEQIAEQLYLITPVRLRTVADYYRAAALRHTPEATKWLEMLTDGPLAPVRARAQLALGTNAYLAGDYDRARSRYIQAKNEYSRSSPDVIGQIHLAKMLAVLQSIRGNHTEALHQLQAVWRLAKTRAPLVLQCDILNSVAIELLSLGQPESALSLITEVTSSPYTRAYPEWIESYDQIAQAAYKPTSVSVPKPHGNLYRLSDYRQAKLSRIDYEHRSELCDEIVFGAIRRIVDRADMSLASVRRIIRLINS